MKFARLALSVIGVLAIVMGLVWIAQGTGLFPYPASSFMINQRPWIINGAVAAVIGLALFWGARKFLR